MTKCLRDRISVPFLLATFAVALTLACLAVGYEPIQADPDLDVSTDQDRAWPRAW